MRNYVYVVLLSLFISLIGQASPEKWVAKIEAHIEFQLCNEKQNVVDSALVKKTFDGTWLHNGHIAICADLLPQEVSEIKHIKSVNKLKVNKIKWFLNGKEISCLGYNRDRRILFLYEQDMSDAEVASSLNPQKGMKVRTLMPTPLEVKPSYFVEIQELNSFLEEPSYFLCHGQPGMPVFTEKGDELIGVIAVIHQVSHSRAISVLIPIHEMLEDIQILQKKVVKDKEKEQTTKTEANKTE